MSKPQDCGTHQRILRTPDAWFLFRQRSNPALIPKESPQPPARPRESPQRSSPKALLPRKIPAYSRSTRKRQDRPVTRTLIVFSPNDVRNVRSRPPSVAWPNSRINTKVVTAASEGARRLSAGLLETQLRLEARGM